MPTEDQVILEEPASSTGTLSSLQNLKKYLSFTDQFFIEKPQEEEPGKTNAKAEVQSMVSVPIHQNTSSVPPMTTLVIDLMTMQSDSPLPTSTATTLIIITTTTLPPPPPPQSTTDPILVCRIGKLEQYIADLVQYDLALEERLDKHGSRLYKLENLNIPHQVSKAVDEIVANAVDWVMQAPLRARFRDLPTVDMKEILQQRMLEDNSYKDHEVHIDLYEALQKSLELDYSNQRLAEQEEARKKRRKIRDIPRTPPGFCHLLLLHLLALISNKAVKLQVHPRRQPQHHNLWLGLHLTLDLSPLIFLAAQALSPTDSLMQDDSIPDKQVYLSDDEDSGNDHLPKADSRKDWWKPLPEEEGPVTPEPTWTIPSSNKSDVANNWASALAITCEHPAENSLLAKTEDMTTFLKCILPKCRSPLVPDGGVSQDTYRSDLEYLRYGSKRSCPALSISKMKAANYPDFGLELLVPEQMWIDDVCTYDVSVKYGISHWWFTRQKFYIDRHDSPSRRKDVKTYMRILGVVRIKAYSRYGYDYLSEIVLRRADHQEHTIVEKDFKN
ncbi:hypothetical protein Tco_1034246, partial [Tanacetum coccineum]